MVCNTFTVGSNPAGAFVSNKSESIDFPRFFGVVNVLFLCRGDERVAESGEAANKIGDNLVGVMQGYSG